MKSFFYRVGSVETKLPWLLPNFDRVKLVMSLLKNDTELSEFKIFLHGDILKSFVTWDVKLFLEFENWEMNLDMVFLERVMSKIYKYGFDNKVLLDVTFCGNHQFDDLYSDAKSRDFDVPSFNNSDFIKFNSVVKSVDGISEEILISDKFTTTQLSEKLVKWSNSGTKYSSSLIDKNNTYIFKEGLLIDIFVSFSLNQFEEIKKDFNPSGYVAPPVPFSPVVTVVTPPVPINLPGGGGYTPPSGGGGSAPPPSVPPPIYTPPSGGGGGGGY